jgi:hypothetical protein
MIVIYGLIIVSEMALAFLNPALCLPNWAPTQGGFIGFVLFTATRTLFGTPAANDDESAESSNEIGQERINQAARHRMAYQIASATAVAISGFWISSDTPARSDCVGIDHDRESLPSKAHLQPDGLSGGIRRQGLLVVVRSASGWYYLALLPASIVALFGSKVYLYWVPNRDFDVRGSKSTRGSFSRTQLCRVLVRRAPP